MENVFVLLTYSTLHLEIIEHLHGAHISSCQKDANDLYRQLCIANYHRLQLLARVALASRPTRAIVIGAHSRYVTHSRHHVSFTSDCCLVSLVAQTATEIMSLGQLATFEELGVLALAHTRTESLAL